MKRFLLAIAIGLSAFAATAGPIRPADVNYQARQTFLAEFGQVKDVQWSTTSSELLRASFVLDGQEVAAFFDTDGSLLATTLSMKKEQLPLRLRLSIDQAVKGKTITEIYYVEHPEQSAYYFSVAGSRKVYRGYANGIVQEATGILR
ncbi:MAG: hypothetical protein MUF62_05320 [Chitinophagaceae bacterium]|jgi:hypothetical protein|nr:hypothetical protein [Chitinophagaceae bacterium]